MHMALPMPKRRTLLEQIQPATVAVILVVIGTILIPIHYPVHVSDGKMVPDIVRPAEVAQVKWTQNWNTLCPVTVTREFVGSDGFPKTALPYELKPPLKTGVSPYEGKVIIPGLPVGPASYRSKIEPHCWIDAIYQRHYYTPEIHIQMLAALPSGPR